MPNWLTLALSEIGPMTSMTMGIVKLVRKILEEVQSSDDTMAKMEAVAKDVAAAAPEVRDALLSNTKHA